MSTMITLPPHIEKLLETDANARKRLEEMATVMFSSRDDGHVPSPEVMASIGRGLADLDAGRVIDGDVVMAQLYADAGLENPPSFNRNTRNEKKVA
jgi:predicted transcriptional regulator